MKKEKLLHNMKECGKKAVIGMATHYANVSCPLILHQPRMQETVKKLRKF